MIDDYNYHFRELRTRLLRIIIFFLGATAICYSYHDKLYRLLVSPLEKAEGLKVNQLIYTGLAEAFISYLQLAMFGGFVLSMPMIAYQIYSFVAPGLYVHEKRILKILLGCAPLLFWGGGVFMFFYLLPAAWQFFLSFQQADSSIPLVLYAKLDEYLAIVMQLILAFGLAFQLPLILIILRILGIITTKQLTSNRRLAIVFSFILGALLTPPDIISQFALAIPLVLLYELAIMICNLVIKEK